MPRRNRNRRRGGATSGYPVQETMTGDVIDSYTTVVSGTSQFTLNLSTANFGSRVAALSDLYRLYRFVRLEAHFLPLTGAAGVIVAFASGLLTAAPTLAQEVSQFDCVAIALPESTIPTKLVLSRAELAGIAPWYQTQGSAAEPLLDTQGQIVVTTFGSTALATASVALVHWRFTLEFAERLPATVTISRLRSSVRVAKRLHDPLEEDSQEEKGDRLKALTLEEPASPVMVPLPRMRNRGQ